MAARVWCGLPTHWDCLSLNAPAVEVAAREVAAREVVELVVVADVLAEVEEPVVAARVRVQAGVRVVKAVRAAPEVPAGPAGKAAQQERVEEALRIRIPTIRIRSILSRGPSFGNFLPQRRPISRFLPLSRRERAGSPYSTPTTCWEGWRRSVASRTSFIFWATCRRRPLREVATR